MENKLAEPHLTHGILLRILVLSPRKDMKGDGYSMIRRIVRNERKGMSRTLNRAHSPFVVAVKVSLANSEPAAKDNVPLMPK